MPKLVDHEERRRAIIAAAWQIIADRGIDGINMRDLAAEAGYTNGALTHYFSGKNEILQTAFEHVIYSTNLRIAAGVGRRRGHAALRKLCFELMPLTEGSTLEARIAVSLWQRAMTDPVMVRVNNLAVADWRTRIAGYWREAVDVGELPAVNVERGVDLLMTAVIGLQVTAALYPGSLSRKSQLAMLDAALSRGAGGVGDG